MLCWLDRPGSAKSRHTDLKSELKMNKQMLVLKGPGDAGKSTCIKLTFDDFLRWAIQKKKASTVHYLYLTDREVAAVIKIGKDSIGIASRGDSESQVTRGLAFFASHRCKVVVCATRSRGKPLIAARNFATKQLNVTATELKKSKIVGAAPQKTENIRMAKQLVGWLKKACV